YGQMASESLVKAAHDSDPNVRIAAAQSFGLVLKGESSDFRMLWAADTSTMYRSSLLGSAARAGLRPPELTQWAASRDWRLRAARPSAGDLAAVLASYDLARRDSANDARLAAIQYVASSWKRDSTAFNVTQRAQLARMPIPSDPLERAAGKTVSAWRNWASV